MESIAPHGIVSVPNGGNTNCDILTEYQLISSANIEDLLTACTDNHSIQNIKVFYAMLSKSVTGTICDTVFDQGKTLPTDKDGFLPFKIFTPFTVISYLQLPILSFKNITSLLTLTYDYVIPTINTNITHMFLLACTPTHIIDGIEHIQHTLTVYNRINHLAAWYTWVFTTNVDF